MHTDTTITFDGAIVVPTAWATGAIVVTHNRSENQTIVYQLGAGAAADHASMVWAERHGEPTANVWD